MQVFDPRRSRQALNRKSTLDGEEIGLEINSTFSHMQSKVMSVVPSRPETKRIADHALARGETIGKDTLGGKLHASLPDGGA